MSSDTKRKWEQKAHEIADIANKLTAKLTETHWVEHQEFHLIDNWLKVTFPALGELFYGAVDDLWDQPHSTEHLKVLAHANTQVPENWALERLPDALHGIANSYLNPSPLSDSMFRFRSTQERDELVRVLQEGIECKTMGLTGLPLYHKARVHLEEYHDRTSHPAANYALENAWDLRYFHHIKQRIEKATIAENGLLTKESVSTLLDELILEASAAIENGRGNKQRKEPLINYRGRFSDAPNIIANYAWDIPNLYDASRKMWDLIRGIQNHHQMAGNQFSTDEDLKLAGHYLAKLQHIKGLVQAEPKFNHPRFKYAKVGDRRELLSILTDWVAQVSNIRPYDVLGNMMAGPMMRLERWQERNKHPMANYLLNNQRDAYVAEQWLKVIEHELKTPMQPKDFLNYVVFMDVVTYSKKPKEQQVKVVESLTAIVNDELNARNIEIDDECLLLPTGDGMAICLFDSIPTDLANLGMAINQRVLAEEDYKLRIGMHFGHDLTYTDINGRTNVAGPGINWAARVQSKAEVGQVLVSATLAKELSASQEYERRLKSAGVKKVKGGLWEKMFILSPKPSQKRQQHQPPAPKRKLQSKRKK